MAQHLQTASQTQITWRVELIGSGTHKNAEPFVEESALR